MTLALAVGGAILLAAPVHPTFRRLSPLGGLWMAASALAARASLAIALAAYAAFVLPGTAAFHSITHLCWHLAMPVAGRDLGLSGTWLANAAGMVPALVVGLSTVGAAVGIATAARRIRWWLARESLGEGPVSDSVVVGDPRIILAATNLGTPRIIVSSGALLDLDPDELEVALAHERVHLGFAHRSLTVGGDILAGLAWFVPGTRRCRDTLSFYVERHADERAAAKTGKPLSLASAIGRAAGALAPVPGTSALARVHVVERLQFLVGEQRPGRLRSQLALLTATASTAAAIALLVAVPLIIISGSWQTSFTPPHHLC